MGFYAVCYAHVCRWEKATDVEEACQKAFGVTFSTKTTVVRFPSNPKYLSLKKRNEILERLYARHKQETGHEIK